MGEFLAAYLFEKYGIEAVYVDRDDADLWIRLPNGTLATVQVKATEAPLEEDGRSARYNWMTAGRFNRALADVDLYAFVALDKQLMVVLPRRAIRGCTYKMPPDRMNTKAQEHSIEELLG